MVAFSLGALVLAYVITLIEYTEVAVLIFALGAERGTLRMGAIGAMVGTALVAAVAIAAGSVLAAIPSGELLGASAIVLAAFGVFLFRSALRTYRRARSPAGSVPAYPSAPAHFAGGFTVGAIETTEAVVVLVPIAAAGQASAAVVGAVAAAATLWIVIVAVHERVRRIKTPWLKLGATSLLFTFAAFWGGEALGVAWPLGDLFLLPIFAVSVVIVRVAIRGWLGPAPAPSDPAPPQRS